MTNGSSVEKPPRLFDMESATGFTMAYGKLAPPNTCPESGLVYTIERWLMRCFSHVPGPYVPMSVSICCSTSVFCQFPLLETDAQLGNIRPGAEDGNRLYTSRINTAANDTTLHRVFTNLGSNGRNFSFFSLYSGNLSMLMSLIICFVSLSNSLSFYVVLFHLKALWSHVFTSSFTQRMVREKEAQSYETMLHIVLSLPARRETSESKADTNSKLS